MTDTITSLIEKLEGAEAGSRELDALVFRHFGEPLPDSFATMKVDLTWQDDGTAVMPIGDMQVTYQPPAYTTSIDAALALAERIVGGKEALLLLTDLLTREADASDLDSITVSDLPLLFCAAILRAQSDAR